MGVNKAFFAARAAVRRMHGPAPDASRPRGPQQAPGSLAAALPACLTFLQGEVPDHVLRGAVARAARSGVSPEQALLSEGGVTEESYYRAMARWLGLPFQAEAFEPGAGARYPESILTGLAPGPDGAWIAAPAGARIAATAAFRRRSNLHLTIATPTTLRRSVERACAFARVVAAAFSQRRKTLRNSLGGLLTQAQITAAGVDPSARPETLPPAQFAALARELVASGARDWSEEGRDL